MGMALEGVGCRSGVDGDKCLGEERVRRFAESLGDRDHLTIDYVLNIFRVLQFYTCKSKSCRLIGKPCPALAMKCRVSTLLANSILPEVWNILTN